MVILRAVCAAAGITLGALDMMIAAHAVASRATLVTHDRPSPLSLAAYSPLRIG